MDPDDQSLTDTDLFKRQNAIVDLIYDNEMVTTNMKNILLIHNEVTDFETFVTAANSETFPIVYSNRSSKEALLQLLGEKFVSISRIAFVFHNGGIESSKIFLDNEPLFTNEDLVMGVDIFSNNMKFIIETSNSFQVEKLDFLACNTLQYDAWKTYYKLVEQHTQATIGASDDLTGNLKYGGDWTLENTNEDIKSIYFTNLIENYQYTLQTVTQAGGTTIYLRQLTTTSVVEYSADVNATTWTTVTWPLTIVNSDTTSRLTVLLTTDITFSSSIGGLNGFIIIGSDEITIDGLPSGSSQSKVVTITGISNYLGLVKNGTTIVTDKTNITIQNIGIVTLSTTTLAVSGGWICQPYFGFGISSGIIKVLNCYSDGPVPDEGGGIFGSVVGSFMTGGVICAENCFSTGTIINGGGIFGPNAGVDSSGGVIYAEKCYSTGTIGTVSGGIFGSYTCSNSLGGVIYAEKCYSTGTIGDKAGGIFGSNTGVFSYGDTRISAINCYSTGIIGSDAGGIFGSYAGSQSYSDTRISAINCYSTGDVSGNDSGGIFGSYAGSSPPRFDPATAKISVTNCYTTGQITGTRTGGIFGSYAGNNTTVNTRIVATNCYTIGSIAGTSAGGIFGAGRKSSLTICPNPINCRDSATTGTSTWADDNANQTIAFGTTNIWLDYSPLTSVPWLLKSFNATIYDPNTKIVPLGTSESSNPGLFLSTNYIIHDRAALPETTIDENTGVLTSPITATFGSYIIYVLAGQKSTSDVYSGYNSNTYTFNVSAIVPDPPTGVAVSVTGSTTATVSFTAPDSDGGSPITSYTATASPVSGGTVSQLGSGTSILMSGLMQGTTYVFTVVATNDIGDSDPSNQVTATTQVPTVFVRQFRW